MSLSDRPPVENKGDVLAKGANLLYIARKVLSKILAVQQRCCTGKRFLSHWRFSVLSPSLFPCTRRNCHL
jgi:hypothetical protein